MSSPQHEPTMEEILASIRKIISEDAPEAVPPAAPAAAAEAPAPSAAAADKQELLATPQAPEPQDIEVLELTQEIFEVPVPEPIAMTQPSQPDVRPDDVVFEPEPSVAPAVTEDEGIFSSQTRKAMDDAFDSIASVPEAPAPSHREPAAPLAPVPGATIENVFERAVRESFEPVLEKYLSDNSGAVIERMKPLIREWMDEHFPALLEGAVRTEIERVVKARGRR
jgi:cell pole-organizing protein PopZ